MSSEDSDVKVKQLKGFGKGNKKKKQIIKKVRQEHGTSVLSFPKDIGLKLNQKVIIEKIGDNPLNWEIRIRPI